MRLTKRQSREQTGVGDHARRNARQPFVFDHKVSDVSGTGHGHVVPSSSVTGRRNCRVARRRRPRPVVVRPPGARRAPVGDAPTLDRLMPQQSLAETGRHCRRRSQMTVGEKVDVTTIVPAACDVTRHRK